MLYINYFILVYNKYIMNGMINVSQTLFNADQKLASEGDNLTAYLNQARISTFYQDNPFQILSSSDKFNIPTLGGKIDGSQGSGSRPGVAFSIKEPVLTVPKNNIQLVNKGGIWVPSGMSSF